MNSRTLVIVPTYNEAGNIERLLQGLFRLELDVLIVDDGSSDGTVEIAKSFSGINVIQRDKKMGLGNAYRAGYAWALENNYERIIQMDADGSHQVSNLENMLKYSNENPEVELIIGSRWVKGGAIENWSKKRELLSRSANKYTQSLLGLSVGDSTAGFRIYNSELLKRIDVQTVKSEGYCFQIEMTLRAAKSDALISEVPITFTERESGVSKMSSMIIAEAFLRVTYWGLFKNFYHLGLFLLALFSGFTTLFQLAKSQRSEYYASIAMSMSKSFSNFLFGAIDPAGTVTLDKIPGSYWLPAIFVKIFGFSTWSIIAPNAILTVFFVLVVAMIGKRVGGTTTALISGAIAATTPIVVAVGRTNQPQSAFLFTLAISAFWAVKALQSQRRRDLVITGLFIALAFHTYMLEAWALWPELIIAWMMIKKPFASKLKDLLIAGTTSLVASLTWILIVWLTPANNRPYIGGTYHNNPFEMVFGYNGLGRFSSTTSALSSSTDNPNFRSFTPPFGGSAGFGRIFSEAVAGQIAWLIPAAALSFLLLIIMRKLNSVTLFVGVWLATFFTMFSLVSGIHQFYTSSLSIPVSLLIAYAISNALTVDKKVINIFLILLGSVSAYIISRMYKNYLQWSSIAQVLLASAAIALIVYNYKKRAVVALTVLLSLIFTPATWAIDAHKFTNSINPVAGDVNSMGGMGGFGGFGAARNGANNFNFRMQGGSLNSAPNFQPPNFQPGGRPDSPSRGKDDGFNFSRPRVGSNLGGAPGRSNFRGAQGGMNFGARDVSAEVKYLKSNRNGAKFLLVTFGAQSAASYITSTGENVLPIGGFDGQDPTPTLEKFKQLVAKGDIRYVLAGQAQGMGGEVGSSNIRNWVNANCQLDSKAPINNLYLCSTK